MGTHEYGDEFYRPTDALWRCPKCGIQLSTVSAIQSHKSRDCKPRKKEQDLYEEERQKKIAKSLEQLKKEIRVN